MSTVYPPSPGLRVSGSPGKSLSPRLSFTTRHGVTVSLQFPTDTSLQGVVSALEAYRLLARKAWRAGLSIEEFEKLLQTRAEADRFEEQAQAARAQCKKLLTVIVPSSPSASEDSPS